MEPEETQIKDREKPVNSSQVEKWNVEQEKIKNAGKTPNGKDITSPGQSTGR